MTYVDAYHNKRTDQILISERISGKRCFNTVNAEYSFYYPDEKGKYVSIHNQRLSKFITKDSKKFNTERKNFPKSALHESDIKPLFKTLEAHYKNSPLPKTHNASIDIEVDFCTERGFAPPDDPHQPITAITIGFDWLNKLVTLVLPPKTISIEEGNRICDNFEDCYLFEDERELLITFCELIEDVDILYTWNGEGFDIPYIVNRMTKVLGKDYTKKLCLWDLYPTPREFERFGKTSNTYDLIGRIHLDYLQLYRKFTYHEMHSYRLDAIAEYELGKGKVAYEGTLDQLYNNDFEKFIRYNREDTLLLTELDEKLKFLSLVNTLAHDNSVLLPNTLGTVVLTDQAIVLEAHERGFRVPDRQSGKNDSFSIAGGYVADPKSEKLWKWIGSVDINSLYPSTIRALNMSPETLVAQVKHTLTKEYLDAKVASGSNFADSWNNVFSSLEYTEIMNKTDTILTVQFERDSEEQTLTAAEIYDWIFNDPTLCISANGTIFKTDVVGIIPGLLTRWYADRKDMQAKKKEYAELYSKEMDKDKKQEYKELRDFWDQRQHATKIKLNALYGAISNVASRFADQRIGQSTTLTGRSITKHQNSKVNEILAGQYLYDGTCIIYSDTDSVGADSMIQTNIGNMTIEQLFLTNSIKWSNSDKEYSTDDKIVVLAYNPKEDVAVWKPFNYVYRHKVKKGRWKIIAENGKEILVTEDHSIMIERDNNLLEIKPKDLLTTDILVSISNK